MKPATVKLTTAAEVRTFAARLAARADNIPTGGIIVDIMPPESRATKPQQHKLNRLLQRASRECGNIGGRGYRQFRRAVLAGYGCFQPVGQLSIKECSALIDQVISSFFPPRS